MRDQARKCRYCGYQLIIRKNSFRFKGVGYDLPYCRDCNTIFPEDVERVINAIRSLECQKAKAS